MYWFSEVMWIRWRDPQVQVMQHRVAHAETCACTYTANTGISHLLGCSARTVSDAHACACTGTATPHFLSPAISPNLFCRQTQNPRCPNPCPQLSPCAHQLRVPEPRHVCGRCGGHRSPIYAQEHLAAVVGGMYASRRLSERGPLPSTNP